MAHSAEFQIELFSFKTCFGQDPWKNRNIMIKTTKIICKSPTKRAISSVDHALDAGLNVKVNCVLQKDLNFDEIIPLVELARSRPISVRFIEFMPFNGNEWAKGAKFVSLRDILK